MVAIDDEAILICPWASRSPFELRIVPRNACAVVRVRGPGRRGDDRPRRCGPWPACSATLPQFNLWVRTAPSGAEEFCWHIDIVPRLTIRAGFELGTGVDISTYAPERATSDLREALA